MLRRIVQNLAANAVRYTEIGHVLICARPRGREVCIAVYDTGPGIADAERDVIFQEFERGEASERGKSLGFGLGLSICAPDCQRHLSTTFSCAPTRGAARASACESPERWRSRVSPAAQSNRPSRQMNLSARAVIIENDKAIAAGMMTLLRQWGCETKAVRNFSEASDLAGGPAPDIVIADYHLDNGEVGLKSVRLLRKVFGDGLPAVVLTADRTPDVARGCQGRRCELMLKPVKPAEMRSLIAHLLRR